MFVRKNGILYNLNLYAKVFPDKDRCALCLADVQGDFDTIEFNNKRELEEAYDLIIKFFKMSDRKKKKEEDNILDLDESQHVFRDEKIRPSEEVLRDLNPWESCIPDPLRDSIERDNTLQNPWRDPLSDPLANPGEPLENLHEREERLNRERELSDDFLRVDPSIPPVGVSREEWEESIRRNRELQSSALRWNDLYENVSLNEAQTIRGVNTFDSHVSLGQPVMDSIRNEVEERTESLRLRVSNLEHEHNNSLEELRESNEQLEREIEQLRTIVYNTIDNTIIPQHIETPDDGVIGEMPSFDHLERL